MEEPVFDKHLKKLLLYEKVFKHTFVPSDWEADEQLAKWSDYLRKNWKKLPKEHRTALKEIDFVYFSTEVFWFTKYFELANFLKENSISDLNRGNRSVNGLYSWFYRQKYDLKHNRISQARKKLIYTLGITLERVRPTTEALWSDRFKQLTAFRQEYGHCNVPADKEEYRVLSQWVRRQRRKEKNNLLDPKRKNLLEKLGIVWSGQIQKAMKDRWASRIKELLAYQKQFGTLTVTSIDPSYHSLRIWVERMRQQENKLHPSRRKQLRELGFPFRDKIQKRKEEGWEKMYQQLRAFYRKYKHSRVSANDKENPKLGSWVNTLRKKGRNNLTAEQRRKLIQVRFIWDIQKEVKKDFESAWDDKFLKLQKFHEAHGHCYVRKEYSERGLYSWVDLQRKNLIKLHPSQVKRLNDLHFEWVNNIESFRQRQWENRYNALLNFFTKYGHCNVPVRFIESPGLGAWVHQLRKGIIKLTPKRLEQLKKVNFEWPEKALTLEERWQEKFNQLKEFHEIHQHVKIPLRYNGNTSLHDWLRHQRKLNKQGRLINDHKRLLEKVDKRIFLK